MNAFFDVCLCKLVWVSLGRFLGALGRFLGVSGTILGRLLGVLGHLALQFSSPFLTNAFKAALTNTFGIHLGFFFFPCSGRYVRSTWNVFKYAHYVLGFLDNAKEINSGQKR